MTIGLPEPGPVIEQARQLHKQALTVVEALAASQPGRREEYQRVAEQARASARGALRTLGPGRL